MRKIIINFHPKTYRFLPKLTYINIVQEDMNKFKMQKSEDLSHFNLDRYAEKLRANSKVITIKKDEKLVLI